MGLQRELARNDWKGLRAIAFDFDGTLFEDRNLLAYENAFRQKGIKVPGDFYRHQKGRRTIDALRTYLLFKDSPQEDLEEIRELKNWYKREQIPGLTSPSLQNTLESIKEMGLGLGIVTSEGREEVRRVFSHYPQICWLFPEAHIITNEDYKIPKPSGEPLEVFLRRAAMLSSSVLYIGDSESDRECAQNARTHFAPYTQDDKGFPYLRQDDFIIRDWETFIPRFKEKMSPRETEGLFQ